MGIKYSVNENFFSAWSPGMAYILGYFYADGSLENAPYIRGKYVRVGSTDKDRIQAIKYLLNSGHTIVRTKRPRRRQDYFLLRIGSHKMYNQLSLFGLTPNKSLTMEFPSVPHKYLSHFIRGYFDGDGCIFFEKRAGITQKEVVKALKVIFTSGSAAFLETLSFHIGNELRLRPRTLTHHGSSNAYQLRYSTEESIRLFSFMYAQKGKDLYLVRKWDIFRAYFERRPERMSREIVILLNSKGPMVKG